MNHLFEKAKEKYKEKKFKEAIDLFNDALEADPDNSYIFYERGITYFHLGKKSLALVDLDKALELQPENPYRYSSRAFIRDACGDVDGAIADYKKAIELDPEDSVAHNNLGLLEEKKGYQSYTERYNKADELAQKYNHFDEQPQEDNFVNKYVKMGDQVNLEDKRERPQEHEETLWGIVKYIFTSQKGFKDFIRFIGRGFRS